eukprot:220014-Rhodomonas_salina.1
MLGLTLTPKRAKWFDELKKKAADDSKGTWKNGCGCGGGSNGGGGGRVGVGCSGSGLGHSPNGPACSRCGYFSH